MIHSVAIIKNVVDRSVTEVESTMFYWLQKASYRVMWIEKLFKKK